jgi:hypothetical protein
MSMKQLKTSIRGGAATRTENSAQAKCSHCLVPVIRIHQLAFFFLDLDGPKNLVTDQVTENTAIVSWDPVEADIDRYVMRYTSTDGETMEVPVGKEKSSTILTGLRPGMEYKFDVWAQKGTQESKKASTKAPTGNENCPLGM